MNITDFQMYVFDAIVILTYFLYVLVIVGVGKNAPEYVDDVNYYVKLYISLFLIWRFNTFRSSSSVQFNELDKKIAFNAGIFLFMSSLLGGSLNQYL